MLRSFAALAGGLLALALFAGAGQAVAPAAAGLAAPREKEIAMELVSSAENSTLDWRREYGYIEDIGDGRGYTAGLIGFCSGTGDMLELVRSYVAAEPDGPLAPSCPRCAGSTARRPTRGSASPSSPPGTAPPATRSSSDCRCASSIASTSTPRCGGRRPMASAPSASSSTTTRS
jgi:hypothetical protein